MLFTNAKIFLADKGFVKGGFRIEGDRFAQVFTDERSGGKDLGGALVLPGLVDIHIHGAAGADFSDGEMDGLVKMASYLAKNGVTSFAPTSMTLPYDVLAAAFKTAVNLGKNRPKQCARPMGIHMEGPFLSEKKKGAQNSDYLKLPDFDAFLSLYKQSEGLLRITDVAPELEGALSFTKNAKDYCKISVAHTDADYEQALAIYLCGASHLTHLFNAMTPIHHRKPGVIGAACENENVTAELICDGIHVHPSSVRMAFKLFPGRICLISDALRCCGMPDGEYELGGLSVYLSDNVARLGDGTIAGAASNLFRNLKNAVKFGVPVNEAILSSTYNPAKALGCEKEIGAIKEGLFADFLICDDSLNLKEVWLGGVKL